MSQKVKYKGKEYRSLRSLVDEYGVNYYMVWSRLRDGKSIEEAMGEAMKEDSGRRVEKVIYKGKEYGSMGELAREIGIGVNTLRLRIKLGWSIEEAVETPIGEVRRTRKILYKGKEYESIVELAKKLNIKHYKIEYKLKEGKSVGEAVEEIENNEGRSWEVQEIVYRGKTYKGISALSREVGVGRNVINSRLDKGWSIEEAVETAVGKVRTTQHIVYKGKRYTSVKELADSVGIVYNRIRMRLKDGWSVEEAVEKGVLEKREDRGVKEIEYKGKWYMGLSNVARAAGVNRSTLMLRLKKGMSIEEAVEDIKRKVK